MPSVHPSRIRLLAILLVLAAIAGAVLIARSRSGSERPEYRAERLRGELRAAKAAVHECRAALAEAEARFERIAQRTDSLLEAVRAYEAEDPAGVPAAEYESYLATFERYNAAVPRWRERADSLRAQWAECRALAERHNLLADSLREAAAALHGE